MAWLPGTHAFLHGRPSPSAGKHALTLYPTNDILPLTKNGKEEYFLKVSRILRQRNAQQTGKKERKFP